MKDIIEQICIKSGIYTYLYCNEAHTKLEAWCKSKRIDSFNCLCGDASMQKVFARCFGPDVNITLLPSITNIMKKKSRIVGRKKCIILYINNRYRLISLIRNMLYRIIFFRYSIITYRKLFKEINVDFNYVENVEEIYSIIMEDIKSFNKSINTDNESYYNKRLIADYLLIRDFVNAKHYAQIMINKGMDKDDNIKTLINDIEDALWSYRCQADKKDVKHIVCNWIDSLEYRHLSDMAYTYDKVKEGIHFANMYCVTPYTKAAMYTFFTGKTFIDDGLWRLNREDIKKSKLYACLEELGYNFSYIGDKFSFDEQCNRFGTPFDTYTPSTLIQYNLLIQMANATKPTFFMVHNFWESHRPYLNPVNMRLWGGI